MVETTQPSIYGRGKRWAILVGINEYTDKLNYGNLRVCVQDATNIRKVLTEGGFETSRVYLLTDKEPKKPLKEESQRTATPSVPSGRDYLTKLQEAAQSALTTFIGQDVWGSDCQPIFQTLNQIV